MKSKFLFKKDKLKTAFKLIFSFQGCFFFIGLVDSGVRQDFMIFSYNSEWGDDFHHRGKRSLFVGGILK